MPRSGGELKVESLPGWNANYVALLSYDSNRSFVSLEEGVASCAWGWWKAIGGGGREGKAH